MVHEEAAHAGELVILLGLHLDGELLVREVGAGQLERLGGLRLVLVDLARVLVVAASLSSSMLSSDCSSSFLRGAS